MEVLPKPLPFQTRFCTISIHGRDSLRLMNFTEAEIKDIKRVIEKSWPRPIQATRTISYIYEIKLTGNPWGNPWWGNQWWGASKYSIMACALIRNLLSYLFSEGWILGSSSSVPFQSHFDTLIFRKHSTHPPKSEWMVFKFEGYDELWLIGAQADVIQGIRKLLRDMAAIHDEKPWCEGTHMFKLRKTLWKPDTAEDLVVTTMYIMRFLQTLESFGWSLYASVKEAYFMEADQYKDTWYCVRTVKWAPGEPVFHR